MMSILSQRFPGERRSEHIRYVARFNERDWEALRAMLADDGRLIQSAYPPRAVCADVSMFFSICARQPSARRPRLARWPRGHRGLERSGGDEAQLVHVVGVDGPRSQSKVLSSGIVI
jgi:hypothetical protein